MAEIFWAPVDYYLLDDGSWLVVDPIVAGWFHVQNLLPVLNGYEQNQEVNPTDIGPNGLSALLKRVIRKCHIGFEVTNEII